MRVVEEHHAAAAAAIGLTALEHRGEGGHHIVGRARGHVATMEVPEHLSVAARSEDLVGAIGVVAVGRAEEHGRRAERLDEEGFTAIEVRVQVARRHDRDVIVRVAVETDGVTAAGDLEGDGPLVPVLEPTRHQEERRVHPVGVEEIEERQGVAAARSIVEAEVQRSVRAVTRDDAAFAELVAERVALLGTWPVGGFFDGDAIAGRRRGGRCRGQGEGDEKEKSRGTHGGCPPSVQPADRRKTPRFWAPAASAWVA